ncbi:cation-transporting P-type ATPase [Ferruginivarius sediminum]|uniref:Cation-transporting P-type ATPase n=2 Tax=Ferruginivarius sediminum TaxID=2661937 RepID=A0A369T957_9PROT|nr:cation-transporting P-type ATPase [Ferruginivarius sediminum]RDD61014.1 cation-transporting P-type ATPase [Ferruginivarius sediminum]
MSRRSPDPAFGQGAIGLADGDRAWHAAAPDTVVESTVTAPEGLSQAEAARRLAAYGPNRLPPPKTRGPVRRFLAQFENLLIQVLLGAAVLTAAIGHFTDAAVILAVCLVNAAIGFAQEGKAEESLRAIRDMLSAQATVLREGKRAGIPAEDLVPGDLVILEPGDKVPADIRLLRVKNLQIDEAALTGESVPVAKGIEPVAANVPLGDRASMAYSGTLVTYGQATGVVVATATATEIGRISRLLAQVEPLATPLLRQIARFARWLTVTVLGFAALVFAFGVFARDYTASEMFMAVVSLAVAAIPEGLPAILTIAMAIGVQRMAQRHAIIRRLPAVETLGSVSVICSDKTGTLTKNEMTVRAAVTGENRYEVGGVGYAPHGGLSRDQREFLPEEDPALIAMAQAAALCNEARLREHAGVWTVEGDPMEGALLAFAHKTGLNPEVEARHLPRIDVIPFEAEHRLMATLHHDHTGSAVIFVKGAPERLLTMCATQRAAGETTRLDPDYWHRAVEHLAAEGHRVLAVAMRPTHSTHGELRFDDIDHDLTFLGLVGMIDPPREEAASAVAECRSAGIRVKMITGDHHVTARAIAAQIGFANSRDVLTGPEIEALSEPELRRRAWEVDVFARAAPEHKLRLVEALQAEGHVVAMTGDGVNDAPALRRADVGVAMGVKGTEAAKEAAETVLADDNFASIVAAVREGRTVYDNLKKAIVFLLPINGGESLSIVAAILLGLTLPITPLQILWVNMVSSVALALALAFEPTEPDAMSRPPRALREPLLSGFLAWRIAMVSTLFLLGIFGMFEWAIVKGMEVAEARTIAVNTLVVLEVFYLFSVRYLRTPSLTIKGVLGTRPVLIAVATVVVLQFIFTYASVMERFFDTRPVAFQDGAVILAVGIALLVLLELEKRVMAFLRSRRALR